MNKEQTLEAIKVMQAWCDGKEIDFRLNGLKNWQRTATGLGWNWMDIEYRIAPEKPSINWDHVSDEYVYLTTNGKNRGLLHMKKPEKASTYWTQYGVCSSANSHASFKPGNVPWNESLVMRPGYEGE